jgi:hypothetical protein
VASADRHRASFLGVYEAAIVTAKAGAINLLRRGGDAQAARPQRTPGKSGSFARIRSIKLLTDMAIYCGFIGRDYQK